MLQNGVYRLEGVNEDGKVGAHGKKMVGEKMR